MIAPNFSLKNEKGELVSLKDFAGKKYVVLYFTQRILLRDVQQKHVILETTHDTFNELNAVILGVSADDEKVIQNLSQSMDCHFHY